MGFSRKDKQTEVGEKYIDLVTTKEVKTFYEIFKKQDKKDAMAIYKHFGALTDFGSVYRLDYDVVDRWYNLHIEGTGLENDMLKSWIHDMMIPYNWVSFMMERIEPLQWRDREELKMRQAQEEANTSPDVTE